MLPLFRGRNISPSVGGRMNGESRIGKALEGNGRGTIEAQRNYSHVVSG